MRRPRFIAEQARNAQGLLGRLARKSHPTNARLGGQSDRHVSGVAGMLAGGASRRAEYWNLLRCRRSEESVSVGLGMTPRE